MAPPEADLSYPRNDQCPALPGDNFPQHELGCENVRVSKYVSVRGD